jgi:hypothetical protein
VLLELVADERLEGCQHFAFKEYKNANGDCILGGHANGSVSYQIISYINYIISYILYDLVHIYKT